MPQSRHNTTVIIGRKIDWGSDAMFGDRCGGQPAACDSRGKPARFGRTLAVQMMSARLSLRCVRSPPTWCLDIVPELR
jgi:hypothetical protein